MNTTETTDSNLDTLTSRPSLKSSEDWLKSYPGLKILDPDGWDRGDPERFSKSWDEKITWVEFERRVGMSTCEFSGAFLREILG